MPSLRPTTSDPVPASAPPVVAAAVPKPKNKARKRKSPPPPPAPTLPETILAPPPAVPEVQLKIWCAVLQRRKFQIQRLPQSYIISFANDIISDLSDSRFKSNEYTKDVNVGEKENSGGSEANPQDGGKVDHCAGRYSSLFLTQQPPPADISADDIGLHLLALFYRSVDDRLPSAMQKHGVDRVRAAFLKLDYWFEKWEDSEKRKRLSMDTSDGIDGIEGDQNRKRKQNEDGAQNNGRNASKSQQRNSGNVDESQRSNGKENSSNKRMRKDPPELIASTDKGSGTLTAQKPLGDRSLPSKPQADIDADGNKKRKDPENRTAHTSGSEQSARKATSQPQKGPTMASSEKENNSNSKKSSQHPSSETMSIDRDDRPKHGSATVAQKKPAAEGKKSTEDQRKAPPEQKQNNAGASNMSESRQGMEKEFLPPQQQGKPIDNVRPRIPLANVTIRQKKNNGSVATPPQQTPANSYQRKDPPELMRKNGGASKLSGSQQQQGTAAKLAAAGKHQQGSAASNSVSHRMQDANATAKDTSIEIGQRGDGRNSATESLREATQQKAPQQSHSQQASKAKPSSAANSKASAKATPAVSATDGSNLNQTCTTSQKEKERPLMRPNEKKDGEKNSNHNAQNAVRAAPRPTESRGNEASNAQKASSNKFDDMIDLTLDSEDESPPSAKETTTPTQPIKENDEEKNENPMAQPPSPPASPLPHAKIHNPPPLPQPKPKPFSQMTTLLFRADGNPIFSGSLKQRPSCGVSYDAGFHLDGSGSCLDDEHRIDVSERLKKWDPYWKIVEELGIRDVDCMNGSTRVGTRTTSCMPAQRVSPEFTPEQPTSCASLLVNLPREVSRSVTSEKDSAGRSLPTGYRPWGVKWGNLAHPYQDEKGRTRDRLQTGDRRVVVRTLPLQRSSKDTKKRADCHIWPKGTFLQLKRGGIEKVLPIVQRKQQSHDPREWKGMSHPLDLTREIVHTNAPFELKLCSKESCVVDNSTTAAQGILTGSYGLHVGVCEYVGADALYDQLMGGVPGSEVTIPKISLKKSKKMAKEYLTQQTVSIVDSDDEDNAQSDQRKNADEGKTLTFSLLCSISKTAMQTPVRGRNCTHLQCFDLKNYLYSNENITGGRWRCVVCESFVSVRDLVHCGLFQAMLDTVGDKVSGARDRVSLRSDGTWKLMDENRLRYGNKRKNEGGGGSTAKKAAADEEVIDLL